MSCKSLNSLSKPSWQSHCTKVGSMRRSAGFTMIEMMMVVAVMGILTVVAVVGYTRVTRKARSGEVPAIFGELKSREDAYHAEVGKYLPACDGAPAAPADSDCAEGSAWPTPLPGRGEAMDASALPARFQALHVHINTGTLYCQYEVIAGLAGDNTNIGPYGQKIFGAVAPVRNWYYLTGRCDWDGDPLVNAMYWQRDDLSLIGSENEQR
jgi:prepilin-type N-terminal cleavage/methylation domain-containing protein